MKKILTLVLRFTFLVGIGLLLTQEAKATHLMGYDLTYICIPDTTVDACDQTVSSCNYRVFVNIYYDCEGAATTPLPGPGPQPFLRWVTNQPGSSCADPIQIGGWNAVSYTDVTPVCPTAITGCTLPNFGSAQPINGTVEQRHFSDYDFCNVNCTKYTMEWSSCCRNGVITSGAANDGMFAGGTTIDLGIIPCNSSPQFATTPVPYICAGQNFTFSQGAYDPDGDSLVFSLSPCFTGNNNQVGYDPGFTPATPLGASWNVSINRRTGTLSMTANPGNVVIAVLCVTVEEYRNGVKIGQVSRDIQVFVVNCGANNLPAVTGVANPTDAAITGPLQLSTCAGQLACFDVLVADPDLGDSIFVRSPNLTVVDPNGTIVSGGATVSVARGTGANPPIARVCFRPIYAGNYFIIMEVTDDNCPLLGTNQVAIEVNVEFCGLIPVTSAARTTQNTGSNAPVDCYTVEFLIEPNSCDVRYFYDIDPGDNSPIYNDTTNGTTRIFHTFPRTTGVTNYTYSILVVDSAGFRFDTTATVTIVNNSVSNAGPDVTLCPNVPGQIGLPGGAGYTYKWSTCGVPGNPGLPASPNNEVDIVTVRLDNQRNTPLDVVYCLAAIDSFGCPAVDSVTVTFAPKPRPDFVINGNFPEACETEQASFQYVGLRPPGITYIWDFTSATNAPNNPLGPGPHFASWQNFGFPTVSLQTVVKGCTSDVVTHPIEIKPIPESDFSVPLQVCTGAPGVISFTGRASTQGTGIWDFDGGTVVGGNPNGLDPISVTWATPGMKIITLTVEDRDCFSSEHRDTIIVNKIPTSDFNLLSPVCQNDSVRLTYTGNASSSGSFVWQFDGANTNPGTNGQIGPYNVTWNRPGAKDVCLQVQELGCFSPVSCQPITVLATPEASIAPVADLCFNNGVNAVQFSYTGTSNVDTYEWFFGPTASVSVSNNPNPTPITFSSPGVKTVRVLVTKDGCVSDTASVTFEVLDDPSAQFIINSTGNICAGDTVTFLRTAQSVSSSETYTWNFGTNAVPSTSNLLDPGPVVFSSGGSKVVTLIVRHGPGCEARFANQLRVEDAPNFNAGADLRYCEGTGGTQINATTSGGVPAYTWNWTCDRGVNCGLSSNAVEDPSVNPTGVGPDTITYAGYAVDTRGCRSNIDEVKIIIDPKPLIDAGPDMVLCDGGPGVNLQGGMRSNNRAAGPFTWEWSDSTGNTPPAGMTNYQQPVVYARPNATTIYTLIVVDQSTGCTSDVTTVDSFSTTTVLVLPRPVADAGHDTVVCFGNTIELRGAAIGGTGNYSYQWSPDNPLVGTMSNSQIANPVIGPFQTTTYTLVVTASGCTSSADQINVTVHTVPTVDAGDDKVTCFGDSLQLDGGATGAPQNGVGYTYSWTPIIGLGDPTMGRTMASPGATQVYQLEVSSDFGCGSGIDNMTLTVQPKPEAMILNDDAVICEGEQIILRGTHTIGGVPPANPNVIYDWQPSDEIDGDNTNPLVIARPTKSTNFIMTTSIGACSTSDEVLISVTPGIEANIIVSDTVICSGETISLAAEGGFGNPSYSWTPALDVVDPASIRTDATPSQTVTYRLTMTEGACTGEDEVSVVVNKTPTADYFASATEGCTGLEVSFVENGTDGVAYIWDFGDGTDINNEEDPIHTFMQAGEFDVKLTVVGEGACEASIVKERVTISEGPIASFVSIPTLDEILYIPNAEVEFLDRSENGATYLWDFGDGEYSTEKDPIHNFERVGQFDVTLTVTDSKGCVSTALIGKYDVQVEGLVIPNIMTPNGDGFNDEFRVVYDGNANLQVEIFDRWGRRYFISNGNNFAWDGTTLSGENAAEGIYFYSIVVGDQTYTGNITLMR
ncbi:MAG: PKD domain-containing protein [Bacteroidia bacterium]